MDDYNTIIELLKVAPQAIFILLYWRERQRSTIVSDERIAIQRECNRDIRSCLEKVLDKVDIDITQE